MNSNSESHAYHYDDDTVSALICPTCQAPNPVGSTVCAFCGTDLPKDTEIVEIARESETELDEKPDASELTETCEAAVSSIGSEPAENLTICPNCLEPNPDGLAVCPYCGMPLHPNEAVDPASVPEDEETLAANRAAAVPEEKKEKKNEESGFRKVMPWLGLYIIYYAITGMIETSRQEDLQNPTIAYLSWVIYIIAGLLMAWPLVKKGWAKLFPGKGTSADSEETEVSEESSEVHGEVDDSDETIEEEYEQQEE